MVLEARLNNVRDTANVLASTKFGGVVQEESVEEGDQWGTLAASSLVADAEVRHGGEPSPIRAKKSTQLM